MEIGQEPFTVTPANRKVTDSGTLPSSSFDIAPVNGDLLTTQMFAELLSQPVWVISKNGDSLGSNRAWAALFSHYLPKNFDEFVDESFDSDASGLLRDRWRIAKTSNLGCALELCVRAHPTRSHWYRVDIIPSNINENSDDVWFVILNDINDYIVTQIELDKSILT